MRFFLLAGLFLSSFGVATTPIEYWQTTRRGANFFNRLETEARFRSAQRDGIRLVRLVFNKWPSEAPSAKDGDFLIGSTDDYRGLIAGDLRRLREVLDWADRHEIRVVLSTLSLPGARWKQQNQNKLDSRLWRDTRFQEMAAAFWRDLARALKGHPAIAGLNLINEPYPEIVPPTFTDWYTGNYDAWAKKVDGTPADLNTFYARLIRAIREVDPEVPIVVDSGFYSTPHAFKVLRPQADPHVLYSFHMYEPYAYTAYHNKKPYSYPGKVPIGEANNPPNVEWNAQTLAKFLAPVNEWQNKYKVPSTRILVGEFGVYRRKPGAEKYLSDQIALYESNHWHWAFYSYREDTWEGMDYELGTFALPAEYWEAEEKGLTVREKFYNPNPLMQTLRRGLNSTPGTIR